MKEINFGKYYELWVLLSTTREVMYKARHKELAPYNISPRQSAVLFMVQALGFEATPAEISRQIFREPHSISELLCRMEKGGLVKKVKDLKSKNRVRVELTEKGREIYNEAVKQKSIRKIISTLSKDERQQLASLLKKIRAKAMKEAGVESKLLLPPS